MDSFDTITVNVLTRGSDKPLAGWIRDARRFAFTIANVTSLCAMGWRLLYDFRALSKPVPGSVMVKITSTPGKMPVTGGVRVPLKLY